MNVRMQRSKAAVLVVLLLIVSLPIVACKSRQAHSLSAEMQRLGVSSALVLASQAVEDHPVWSPDGRFMAINISERWVRVDLRSINLELGTWHGKEPIGVASSPTTKAISASEVKRWDRPERHGDREVVLPGGMKVELKQENLSTEFRTTIDGRTQTLWRTGLENCHSPSASPDGQMVAYICELNGVIVTRPQ